MPTRWCASTRSVILAALLTASASAQSPAPAPASRFTAPTRAERTRFEETSRYEDVLAFVRDADAASPLLHQTSFGYTNEGRALPLVVVGRVKDASPEAVRASGLVRVYLQGNIHAGEVEGKEALQMLLRDLVNGQHAAWLDSLVLLVAPIYNADSNERIRLGERPLQNGPLGGVGRRPNAQDLDLNRDHMKLESPEARSLARLLRDYDPHVGIDLHTTNGTYHAYQLTYAPPLHPNTAPSIVNWLRGEWLPDVTKRIRAKDGWDFYYYGNVPGSEGPSAVERGWYTFDHRPRFNNNYLGLRNRIAILSEAYAYLPFEARIAVTRRFVEESLDTAARDAARIRQTVAAADAERLAGTRLALNAKVARAPQPVDILMGGVARVRHPLTGQIMLQRTDERRVERMPEFGTFAAGDTETVPAAYIVPPALDRVIDLLSAHGVRTRTVSRDTPLDVERFVVAGTTVAERAFQGHRERAVTGAYRAERVTIPAGAVVVPMDQPLARLIFTLLEPRSDDGVVNWNFLEDVFEKAAPGESVIYPIQRTMALAPR
jgi:Zinc carboxypeptidase